MRKDKDLIALAGQPNCGKSTVFNALTGAIQHVANYPGVTVDKMTGWLKHDGKKIEIVDLPGTYSLTSFSLEERISRDFILDESPSVVVNVLDASNLKRSLYLTFQLLEMDIPVVLDVNMMDVATKRSIKIDFPELEKSLGVCAVPTTMKSGTGKKELIDAVMDVSRAESFKKGLQIDYGAMEPFLRDIRERLAGESITTAYPVRWITIKLMEGDKEVAHLIRENHPDSETFLEFVTKVREEFEHKNSVMPEIHIAQRRYQAAENISRVCIEHQETRTHLSDRIDTIVCHRYMGPLILLGVIWLLYYLSIVQGYNLTTYTWPILAKIRSITEVITPAPGFIDVPLIRSFSLWFVDSINALLNYIPIFFILFGLIAILEDSGYMPRMAFMMDRLFSRFGLHGQSTLPMVLGGIYVGGCAVPGVMSCKGIPDERSRLATILIIPLLNCLAKVPLYVLLINIYFADHKALAMFFISTISLLMVLPVSKVLTMTVLRNKETAPFVMEMPPYHIPALRDVLRRATERVWLFIRKITTIVAAVAVVIFVLLQFPGLSDERTEHYNNEKDKIINEFHKNILGSSFADELQSENLTALVLYWDEYKNARMATQGEEKMAALNARFKVRSETFFSIVQPEDNKEAKKVNRAFKKLFKSRGKILREMRKERIDNSLLGQLGKYLEPVTRWAGFNWRVNVALLSAFAAKESSVATLGALYEQDTEGETLEQRMARGEAGFTPLHALALMLFMVLYPPCLATIIAVKVQTGSVRLMLFSMIYPMVLGLIVAVLVFSGGGALGLSGFQAMIAFYVLALAVTIMMGMVKNKSEYIQGKEIEQCVRN